MGYWVDCVCGNRIEVSDTQAGMTATCPCGGVVRIPSLSELRRQSSDLEQDASPEFIIRAMYGSGKESVGGNACACCRGAAAGRVLCYIEYEKPFFQKQHPWLFWVLFGWFFTLPALIYYAAIKREPQMVSEGRSVEFYLSLCSTCQKSDLDPDLLGEALRGEAVFARLLEKYPEAKISKCGPLAPGAAKDERFKVS